MSIDLLLNSNSWTNLKPNTVNTTALTSNVVYVKNSVGAPNAPVGYVGLYSNSNGILSTSDEKSATNTYLVATPYVNQSGGLYFSRTANIVTYGGTGNWDLLSPTIDNITGSNTIPANSLKKGNTVVFFMEGTTTQINNSGNLFQLYRNGVALVTVGSVNTTLNTAPTTIEFTLTMKGEGATAQALVTFKVLIGLSPAAPVQQMVLSAGPIVDTTIDNTFTAVFTNTQSGSTYTVFTSYMKKL
jgi:hypothetical protein